MILSVYSYFPLFSTVQFLSNINSTFTSTNDKISVMTPVNALYLQVNFLCLFVFWRLLKALVFDYNFQYESKLFAKVLISTAVFTFSDMGWILFTSLLFPGNIFVNWLVNMVYFLASAFIGIVCILRIHHRNQAG